MQIQLGEHRPEVDGTAWLAGSSAVIGRASIGAQCSIWYGASVRADMDTITIGERSNVQDSCTLHTDPGHPLVVGSGVSVGHNAVLHGCTVEDDCLIGMGAVVLNDARVGTGSLVAAGAVVSQGADIPPGSLVAGVPAKVRRELREDEREAIRVNAAGYVELAALHAQAREV